MTPHEFIDKWRKANLSERSAYQQHFLDLCTLLDQPTPAEEDPDGSHYTFEKGVKKTEGGQGFADVWKRGAFGWEYKGKHKDLKAAYNQLLQYREDLENPPLLVVCDLDRFEIHTNFTGTIKQVHAFALKELAEPKNLDLLRRLFTEPESLKPGQTQEEVTQEAAEVIGQIADRLRVRKIPAPEAAHFLMKLMFCMFAEDIELLPDKVFTKILKTARGDPAKLARNLAELFSAMSTGGDFWGEEVLYFNGGLFADANAIELTADEMQQLVDVARLDWANVAPHIFGTLFERCLDPDKRSQIGAHYTSREDIETLLEPVVMVPLRREWAAVQAACEQLTQEADALGEKERAAKGDNTKVARHAGARRKKLEARDNALRDYTERLSHVTILDPACGSGNFLYVALHLLLNLEKEVITYATRFGRGGLLPQVRPTQLAGIEINAYAQELASVVIWIGYLQWMRHNGFAPPNNPVLEPIESIQRMDAILDLSDPERPKEPEWPAAEFIVGNPPFLGGKRLRTELGNEYVEAVFHLYDGRVPREADLVAYWFEKTREMITARPATRAGLLATQSIRMSASRPVLDRIRETGDIFFAWSDRPWVLDGADVRVSLIGFDNGDEKARVLDGATVGIIHSNLTSGLELTRAQKLPHNRDRCFMGDTKGGAFDVDDAAAIPLLCAPNPNGRPNSDVMVPWLNAMDVTRRSRNMWIIDFGVDMQQTEASRYELPFERLRRDVLPIRATNNRATYKEKWWIHVEPRRLMRDHLTDLSRFIVIPSVAKHRLIAWLSPPILADHKLFVVATDSDVDFGLLHSQAHEVWALATSSRHGVGNDPTYNNTTCFETFPFPEPNDAQRDEIASAAKELDTLRNNWLNPPEWVRTETLEFPGSADGPWRRFVDPATVDARGVGTVRYPRLVPADEDSAKLLKKRTLTNLYNDPPTWLTLAHRRLDEAVAAAYGWPADLPPDDLLARLLELNLSRAAAQE